MYPRFPAPQDIPGGIKIERGDANRPATKDADVISKMVSAGSITSIARKRGTTRY